MSLQQNIEFPGHLRIDLRQAHQLRPIEFLWNIAPYADGSILFKCGQTQVICSVMIQENIPRWMKEQNISGGWLTAEYSMLPYSTQQRKERDVVRGRVEGRTQEIQRLIGRSLRAAIDLKKIGSRTICIDCDVISADGGTRTTAITGSYLALRLALERLTQRKLLRDNPLLDAVAATSVGIYKNQPILDLCYVEDRDAEVDMNIVMTDQQQMVEIQASGEEATFSKDQFDAMLDLGRGGVNALFEIQQRAWEERPQRS